MLPALPDSQPSPTPAPAPEKCCSHPVPRPSKATQQGDRLVQAPLIATVRPLRHSSTLTEPASEPGSSAGPQLARVPHWLRSALLQQWRGWGMLRRGRVLHGRHPHMQLLGAACALNKGTWVAWHAASPLPGSPLPQRTHVVCSIWAYWAPCIAMSASMESRQALPTCASAAQHWGGVLAGPHMPLCSSALKLVMHWLVGREPAPGPMPEPAPVPGPLPMPEPAPVPGPLPMPDPALVPGPLPMLDPALVPGPLPMPDPALVPGPLPMPDPALVPVHWLRSDLLQGQG